jgi:mRNA-degrading endonuclease RelE of RelBE toxin-antitoxin system
MIVHYSSRFLRSYLKASKEIQKTFNKQIVFLLQDLHYPSLHAKKYDESENLWQARVNDDWRFYFTIADGIYFMENIKRHPK